MYFYTRKPQKFLPVHCELWGFSSLENFSGLVLIDCSTGDPIEDLEALENVDSFYFEVIAICGMYAKNQEVGTVAAGCEDESTIRFLQSDFFMSSLNSTKIWRF